MTAEVIDLEQALVADYMHAGVLACAPETPLVDVAQLMVRHRIHCVVVLGESSAEAAGWGVVTDLDLAEMAAAGTVEGSTAGDCAVGPTVVVHPGDTLRHAAQLLADNAVTHALVAKEHPARPMGVLSTFDLARALTGSE